MPVTRQEIVESIKGMSVLEVSELVKEIESIFGVPIMSPTPVVVVDSDGANIVVEEEQTEFDVLLKEVGDSRVKVIKIIRAVNGLGLKEAKGIIDELVEDNIPYIVKESVSASEAVELSEKLKAVGAVVEVV